MKALCLFLIVSVVVIIVLGIVKIHTLPGDIAKKRNHPQVAAIEVTSLLGLIIFPFWMVSLIWAYMAPVMKPIQLAPSEPKDA